jgi:L-ascorbate metabolism protein UlaG (beta-lactamase superfamily)
VEITWLGHGCFRLRAREGSVVMDPAPKATGYSIGKPTADLVTVSSTLPDHSFIEGVAGEPRVLDAPGEYEMSGILVTGVRTAGAEGARNVVFVVEMEDVRVCHLGAIGEMPTPEQIEAMSSPDVLLVPAGGGGSLKANQAAQLASLLEAHLVVPMRYKTDAETGDLEPVDRFLKETGQSAATPQPRLQVTKSSLPTELRVALLDYKR